MSTEISLSGCRQHNLRNIDVSLPSRGLTLITGPSGSGKSSLAFATLHAESRRRYLESLSTSERSRFDHISPPDLDDAVHLPLTIAIQPETLSSGSRNTFGTATGIVSVLQMLFASRSECDCPDCGASIRVWETQEIIESLTELPAGDSSPNWLLLAANTFGSGRHQLAANCRFSTSHPPRKGLPTF